MLAPSPHAPAPSFFKRVLDALRPPAARPFQEMGTSGTAVFGGYVQTRERSAKWIGAQRYVTISDMAVNASIVAAGVHYFLNLIARPRWTYEAADESAEAKDAAELVEDIFGDLSQPWSRVVRRAGTYRFYGFGLQEWTAKRRLDGKVGLESIEARPQHTIEQWAVADDGTVEGVFQRAPKSGDLLGIPRRKLLYLVDDVLTDSPEGVGIFRHLAEPWERLKTYLELEARGLERDLRGTPVGRVPYTLLREAVRSGDLTQARADEMADVMEKFVKLQVKQSDTAITLDSIPYYSQAADGAKVAGTPQWGLELLQGGAAGMAEVAAAITRTQTEMARLLTAEHLMMGEQSGNRALGEDKSRNLYLVANAVLEDIAAGVRLDVVPAICDLNGVPEALRPIPRVEDVAFKDAEAVASTLAKMAQAGAVLSPDDPVIEDVRNLMGVSVPAPVSPELMGLSTGAGGDVEDAPEPDEEEDAPEEDVEKAGEGNPYHDEQGRFASGPGGGGAGGEGGGAESGARPAVTGKGRGHRDIEAGIAAIPAEHAAAIAHVKIESAATVSFAGHEVGGYSANFPNLPPELNVGVRIADAVGGRALADPQGTIVHELGHALDQQFGNKFSRGPVTKAVREDSRRLTRDEKKLAAYYLLNKDEMFAEIYALAYSPSPRGRFGLSRERAEAVFARSLRAVKEIKL